MGTSSARPSALRDFTTAVDGMDETLARRGGPLQSALDEFRSSEGWPEWLDDVPPLDIDFAVVRGLVDRVRTFVDQVAAGFEAVDPDPGCDGVVSTSDLSIARHVTVDFEDPVPLVPVGDRWIFPGTDGDDFVRVVVENGVTYLEIGVVVTRGGRRTVRWERRRLTGAQAAALVIRTGGGNDWVAVSPGVRVGVTAWTGEGDDAVGMPGRNYSSQLGGGGNDRIFTGAGADEVAAGAGDDLVSTGAGDDYVDGQDGNDAILAGDGGDAVYGGRGADAIDGGAGDDHLEGGSGADVLRAGDGDDIVSGGRDDDTLYGGVGDDELFGGRGADAVNGGYAGNDRVTTDARDVVYHAETHVTIELTGEPGSYAVDVQRPDWMSDAEWAAWSERIDADLELIRNTPSGRAGLAALDQASRDSDSGWNPFDSDTRIRIVPWGPMGGAADDPAPTAVGFDRYLEAYLNHEPLPGDGAQVVDLRHGGGYNADEWVAYGHQASNGGAERPPVVDLYHELSHAWDSLHDHVEGTYTETVHRGNGRTETHGDVGRWEINSVGPDLDGDGEIDTVAAGDGSDHPTAFTENALRDDLRMRRRTSYTWSTFEGDDPVTFGDTDDD